jgi:2-polyprenyl-6-hydroxyphenyl methylase/3-demethylubiquinone-9 3-methyltransferase
MYVGVDLSFEGLRQAHAAGLRTVRISDASVLPFGPGIFDAAVSIEVLEHLFEPLAAAVEVFRVLKPGGVFVVGVPNVAYWRRRLELGLLGRWNPFGDALSAQQPWRDPHIRFFTVRALREMLRRAGFRSVSVRGSYGAFLGDLPGLRRWSRGRTSRLYSEAEQIYPALFGQRLTAVARKPG